MKYFVMTDRQKVPKSDFHFLSRIIWFNYEWVGVPETFFSVNSNYVQFLSAPHSSCCFQDKMIYFENIDFSPKISLILTHRWRISITKLMLKVRQSRNDFFKPLFPPKNERRNSTLLLWYLRLTCFRSFFGENWRHQKDVSKLTDL